MGIDRDSAPTMRRGTMERYLNRSSALMCATNLRPEANLATHDIALSIQDPHTERHDVFRLLLVSPEDINDSPALHRIQQLHRLSGGQNSALIFLLHHQGGTQAAMHPFMDLHIK